MPDEQLDASRLQNPLEYEQRFWSRGRLRVAGVDEVGRGPLAGPVVACALILPEGVQVEGADDSKKLKPADRQRLAREICEAGAEFGVGAVSARVIDHRNILNATRIAMQRALHRLGEIDHVVVDGLPVKGLGWEHEAVVGGDGLIHSISCASIIAKVARDDLMAALSRRYPGYGWERNSGYGSQAHRDAIEELGETPHHRRTFLGLQYDLF